MNKHKELIISVILQQDDDNLFKVRKAIYEESGGTRASILESYLKKYYAFSEAIDWLRDLPD